MYTMSKGMIPEPLEFNWDIHNIEKNWNKHDVHFKECEQAFIHKPVFIFEDIKHSQQEPRYTLFGQSDKKRYLTITYTIRNNQIRVISARDQNKKERKYYEETK